MAMPIPAEFAAMGPYYTVDILDRLPDDGNRYEVVHGELLVTPAPRALHQEVVGRLYEGLRGYLRGHPVGHAFASPADIRWDRTTGVQPDLFVVPLSAARTMDWRAMRDLLLVIEVVSPSTARADRFPKRRRYQEAGVPCYWIVDPDRRSIEVWTPTAIAPVIEQLRARWTPEGTTEAFEVDVEELFRPV